MISFFNLFPTHQPAVASDPMKQLLIKPIVFLLIVGLVGCTTTRWTTRWTTFEPTESPDPIPHVRVTFMSGVQFEGYDAIVTRETISGTTKDGKTFTVPMDEVRSIEVDSGREADTASTATGFRVVVIAVLIVFE